jgi:PAS domain S-box-containing protein
MPERFALEFATLVDLQAEAQLLIDVTGHVLHANRAATSLLGSTLAALRGAPLQDLLDPGGTTASALLRQGLRSTQPTPIGVLLRPAAGATAPRRCHVWTAALRARDAPSPCVWLRITSHAEGVYKFAALNERLKAMSHELARRRQAEDLLREQGEWLSVVLRSIGDAVVACDVHGRVVFLNPVAERITGCAAEMALGRDIDELVRVVDGETGAPHANPVHIVLREQRAATLAENALLIARDGSTLPIDDAATPIVDDEGRVRGAVLVFRDIGARVRSEQERAALAEQLREVQKMEAIGRLAGGIAHDFNNVVAAILANAGMARDALPPGDGLEPMLRNIVTAGQRARELVQQILAFSRRQPRRPRMQSLQPLIEEAVALLRGTVPTRVQITARLPAEPVRVRVDATSFMQVLLNLCTNAWQAMQGSTGHIEIVLDAAERDVIDGLAPGFAVLEPGPYAMLAVRDDGAGMDEATRARVFEPFFTTKPPGEGTGLGLSVVHGIVSEHGGGMTVESRPGEGTTFTIWLPLQEEPPETVPGLLDDTVTAPLASPTGEVVIYVDDDDIMRLTVDALLSRTGYRVQCFASGAEALRTLSDPAAPCDVLVTDYNMPNVSGLDLAAAVRRVRPHVPIVISTGFVTPALVEGAAAVDAELLRKEESYERLAPLLASLLARRRVSP